MPIYEYKCENGHVFDVMQKMSEDPLSTCVECGAPVRKVLQPVGISFKGSGFYSTDYNSKKGPKEATSTNGDSKPDKPDKKPAEKSASSSSPSTGSKD
jgi:putative FmdB family regulatory protein